MIADRITQWGRVLVVTLGLLAGVGASTTAQAGLLTYTMNGGQINGSLGGTPFTNASWQITALADPSTATYSVSFAPFWIIDPVVAGPTLTITSGPLTLTATLTSWSIFSADYSSFLAGNGANAFSSPTAGNAYIDGIGGLFNNLQSPASFSGLSAFDAGTYATSAGNLIITGNNRVAGTFTISTPEPSGLLLAAAAAATLGGLRRLRRPTVVRGKSRGNSLTHPTGAGYL